MELDHSFGVIVRNGEQFLADRGVAPELFDQLAPEARVERLTGFALATRELPIALEVDALLATRDEVAAVALR